MPPGRPKRNAKPWGVTKVTTAATTERYGGVRYRYTQLKVSGRYLRQALLHEGDYVAIVVPKPGTIVLRGPVKVDGTKL